ncbi:MAG: hypothetical protein ACRDF4_05510 [Rhabdochlamydiaceae bacterium]
MLNSLSASSGLHPDSERVNKVIAILSGVHFALSIDSSGVVSVAHAPEVRQFGSDYDQMVDGAERQIEGFFTVIGPLGYLSQAFSAPDSFYSTDGFSTGYVVSSGSTNVFSETDSLSKNFVISGIGIKTASLSIALRPKFMPNSGGLLLSNLQMHQEQNGMAVDISATIEYQYVEGILVPKSLRLTMPALHSNLEMTFDDYKLVSGARS